MTKPSPQPTAQRSKRHRVGVAAKLEAIRDDLADLKRDVKALVLGGLDQATGSQQERPQ
jgi:hypothetical protein